MLKFIFRLFTLGKIKEETRTFFDFPAEDKKKMVVEAVRGANLMQKDLVDRYNQIYKN